MIRKDVVVIGAGAAGLMCAIEAGKRGRSVVVLERSNKIGKKIRISGGGRCNFTNIYASPEKYLSQNPHYCKSAFARYTAQDFIALVEKYGIKYHEKKLGQQFCDRSSQEIIRLLEAESQVAQVQIKLNCNVSEVQKQKEKEKESCFTTRTDRGTFQSKSFVIASGGLSIPKMGATNFGYEIAEKFGLNVIPCRPALVPFTWNRKDLKTYGELTGISFEAVVHYGTRNFPEKVLFTHKGLSGPAILQISSYWKPGNPIHIDLLPGQDFLNELMKAKSQRVELNNLLTRTLSRRFAHKLVQQIAITHPKPLSQSSDKELAKIADYLHRWPVVPSGTEGYAKAEVTAGGVDTNECSSKTMESKKVPGLFLIGEVMDVTGHLGGYNLQWAWSSGFAAGQFV